MASRREFLEGRGEGGGVRSGEGPDPFLSQISDYTSDQPSVPMSGGDDQVFQQYNEPVYDEPEPAQTDTYDWLQQPATTDTTSIPTFDDQNFQAWPGPQQAFLEGDTYPPNTLQPPFTPNAGFDTGKLNDPTHLTPKYEFLRTAQSNGWTAQQLRGNLDLVVNAMKDRYPNARVIGDDHIDFGDGYGPIDVLTAQNTFWWGPDSQQGKGAGGGAGATGTGGFDPAWLQALGAMLTPPSGAMVQSQTQVGQDPFSQFLTGALGDIIQRGGFTPQMQQSFGTAADLLSRFGVLPTDAAFVEGGSDDQTILNNELERARELQSQAFTSQLNDARAELGSRGLASEPGVGQGEEAGAIGRISQTLAPTYAAAVRDAQQGQLNRRQQRASQVSQQQNARVISALQTVTGLSEEGASNYLNAIGQGTDRQVQLARIALDTLDQNRQWNQFLSQFGLDRARLMNEIAQGNANSLGPLLALFQQMIGIAAGGHI